MVFIYFILIIIFNSFIIYILRLIYFTTAELHETENSTENNFFAYVQLAEIFYILSYSINFYLYCLSSTLFRKQLFNKINLVVV